MSFKTFWNSTMELVYYDIKYLFLRFMETIDCYIVFRISRGRTWTALIIERRK